MNKESISISNIIKTKRYLIQTILLIIPYTAGIIFIDAFSYYYHIRKCETFDETSLSLCSIIDTHYIFMINVVGVIFVVSSIVLMIFKTYHKLNFIQINFLYLCFYTFLISNYIIPELLILLTAAIFLLIYFMFIKSKININILKVTIIIFFLISLIYPFARGFKDFVYYYTEDKWISLSDFAEHNTGKEVWPKEIQTILIGINELKLKEFSARGFTPYETFISAAAWPIRHKSESRWIVHKNNIQLDIPELSKGILHIKEENHTLEGDNKLSQYARCVLIWESNGIHISYC